LYHFASASVTILLSSEPSNLIVNAVMFEFVNQQVTVWVDFLSDRNIEPLEPVAVTPLNTKCAINLLRVREVVLGLGMVQG